MSRYHRQTLLPQIGAAGQARLATSRVLLVGCGALGTVVADQLARAGVGLLRIVDRDVVELTNLQRQILFDEADARDGTPKAVAAAKRLGAINAEVRVEPIVRDLHGGNLEELAGLTGDGPRVDLIIDGTDNVDTRYLLNDVSVKHDLPWVYGACVGTEGRVMAIRPPATACLRCVFPEPPGPGELPTCDTAGVLGPVAATVASLQSVAALKLLTDQASAHANELVSLDLWKGRFRSTSLYEAKRPDCPACGLRRFEFLDRPTDGRSITLCGRNAVQVLPGKRSGRIDLSVLAERLRSAGRVQATPYLLRCKPEGAGEIELTVFADGRAIVHGTSDFDRAKSAYARWVGA